MAGRRAAAGLVGLALIMMTMSTPALASSRDADMDGEDMDGECTSDHALLLSNNKLRQELQQAKDAARRKDVEQDKELHRLQSEAKESWGLIPWCFVAFLVCMIITTVNSCSWRGPSRARVTFAGSGSVSVSPERAATQRSTLASRRYLTAFHSPFIVLLMSV